MFKVVKFKTPTDVCRQGQKHIAWDLSVLDFDIVSDLGASDLELPVFSAKGGETRSEADSKRRQRSGKCRLASPLHLLILVGLQRLRIRI
jgi:hypothetical protein